MAFKAQLGIKWCIPVLFLLPVAGCTASHTQGVSTDTVQSPAKSAVLTKSVNQQLLTYVDSIAFGLNRSGFTEDRFKKLTDSFSRFFPLIIPKSEKDAPENTVFAYFQPFTKAQQRDVVSLSLPYSIGFNLSYKTIIAHFGPLEPEGPLFREHKSPPPIKIDLKSHLGGEQPVVSLYVRSAYFPDETEQNQIVDISIVRDQTAR